MGCSGSKQALFNLETEYSRRQIPQPGSSVYQNDFEKQAFMVINLMRQDPKSMIPQIRSIKQHKFYKGQPIQPLVDYLNSIEPLPLVTLDEHACQACRNNTDRKMKTDEDTGKDHFEKGGNQEEFQGMIGNGKGIETTECTQIGWNGSAQDLIFFLLVDGFKDQKSHAILDPKLIKVGISFKAHKKLHNVFQILYVKQISNNMN